MEFAQLEQAELEKEQEEMQSGEGELAAGDKNVPWALHLQEREMNGVDVLFIAGSRRR